MAEGEVQIDGLEGHQVIDTEGIVAWREGGNKGGREGREGGVSFQEEPRMVWQRARSRSTGLRGTSSSIRRE